MRSRNDDIAIEAVGGEGIKSEDLIRAIVIGRYPSTRLGLRAMLEARDPVLVVGDAMSIGDLEPASLDAEVIVAAYEEEDSEALFQEAAEQGCSLVLIGADSDVIPCLCRLGIRGWALLPRESGSDEIAAAIHAVSEGLLVVSAQAGAFPAPPEPAKADEAPLSEREVQILQLMAEGLPNKQIAQRLAISLHTVKFHVAAILSKLGATSRTEAVTRGLRRGLLHL